MNINYLTPVKTSQCITSQKSTAVTASKMLLKNVKDKIAWKKNSNKEQVNIVTGISKYMAYLTLI